jgi:phage I-like protein
MPHQVLLDLGISDVHKPSTLGGPPMPPVPFANGAGDASKDGWVDGKPPEQVKKATAAADRKAKRLAAKQAKVDARAAKREAKAKLRKRSFEVRADIAPGGSLHVRHLTGKLLTSEAQPLLLTDAGAEGDTTPDGVWIQLAKQGSFAGHPQGRPFKLDARIFQQMVTNFKGNKDGRLPIDFEHASEQDATSGSVPQAGAPAQGWIVDMALRPDGNLWAKVQWGTLAKQYIRDGKYMFISPAIHFAMKDRVTGANIGAYISSAGLTNQPFLDGMQPLAARATTAGYLFDAVEEVLLAKKGTAGSNFLGQSLSQPHEYMPSIRAGLKLSDVATHEECSDHLERLRTACALADTMGMHEGVDLRGNYLNALADATGMSATASPEDILDAVEDMIDAAMARHMVEEHGGANMTFRPQTETPTPEDPTMATPTEADLLAAKNRATTLETEVTTLSTKATTLSGQITTLTARADEAEGVIKDVTALLSLKPNETLLGAVKRLSEENAALLDGKAKREEADITADVERAFLDYKDAKKLDEAMKPALLKHRKESPDSFNFTYPPLTSEERKLLTNVVRPEGRKPPRDPKDPTLLSHTALTSKLMTEKRISYQAASDEAAKMIREASVAADGQ